MVSPIVAAIISFFFPGIGQVVQGETKKGIIMFVAAIVISIILTLASTVARVVIISELTSLSKKDFIINVISRVILASIIPTALIILVKIMWEIEGMMIIPTYLMFEIVLLVVFYLVCFNKREKIFLRSILKRK